MKQQSAGTSTTTTTTPGKQLCVLFQVQVQRRYSSENHFSRWATPRAPLCRSWRLTWPGARHAWLAGHFTCVVFPGYLTHPRIGIRRPLRRQRSERMLASTGSELFVQGALGVCWGGDAGQGWLRFKIQSLFQKISLNLASEFLSFKTVQTIKLTFLTIHSWPLANWNTLASPSNTRFCPPSWNQKWVGRGSCCWDVLR